MWGNFGLFCSFNPKLPRIHVGLHCSVNKQSNGQRVVLHCSVSFPRSNFTLCIVFVMIFLIWLLGKPLFWPVRVQAQWSDFFLLQGTGLQVTPFPFVHSKCFNSSSSLKYVTCHTKITKRVARVGKVTQLFHCHAWNLDSFYWLLYIFFSFTWETLVLEPGDISWLTILYFMFSSIVCLWFWSFLWIDSMNQLSGFPSLQYVAGQEVQIWAGPFGCRGRGEARHSLQ